MKVFAIIKILTVGLILTACESPLGTVSAVSPSFQPGLQTADPYLLNYTSPVIYSIHSPIPPNFPTQSGGAITAYSITPALPAGLSLDPLTGIISGTPTVLLSDTNFTITGTNAAGFTNANLEIAIHDLAPVISYAGTPFVFSKNVAISAVSASNSGGTIVSCAASPTLPAGLSLSASCGISGTPLIAEAATNYTISATNSGGTSQVTVTIAVNDSLPALTYSGSPFVFTKNLAITAQTPSNSGGTVVSCTATPALPTGLTLSATCGISGTASAIQVATQYTIHATSTGGNSTVTISIAVNDAAPVISYLSAPFAFTLNSAISAQTPANSGGAIVSCSANPALPAGLSLSSTCVISGTPTALQASTNTVISAVNTGGTATATIAIAVNDVVPAISFSASPFLLATSVAISSQTPTNSGGAITSCASVPPLPTGLALSSACVISGTPSATQASTAYTISATNSGGTGTASIAIAISNAPTLTSISMDAGTVGNTITLTGTNFVNGLTIQLGTTHCTTSTFVSSTSATCVVPASASIAQMNVVVTNPNTQSATLTNAFTHLMDAKFWLRGDHASATGGLVDTWTDLSGNGFSATGTTTTRPTLTASVTNLGNKPALTFNGTNSILDQISAANLLKNVSGLSWAAALTTADNTAVQQGIWSYSTNSAGSTRFAALMNDTNTGTQICDPSGFVSTSGRKVDAGATWYMCKANAVPTNNAGFIASGNLNFTSNSANTTYDGTTVGSSTTATYNGSTLNTSNTASAAAKIGAGSTGSRFFKGNIAEIVFYNYDIGATNRQALENYLKNRYGL